MVKSKLTIAGSNFIFNHINENYKNYLMSMLSGQRIEATKVLGDYQPEAQLLLHFGEMETSSDLVEPLAMESTEQFCGTSLFQTNYKDKGQVEKLWKLFWLVQRSTKLREFI